MLTWIILSPSDMTKNARWPFCFQQFSRATLPNIYFKEGEKLPLSPTMKFCNTNHIPSATGTILENRTVQQPHWLMLIEAAREAWDWTVFLF